MGTADNSDNVAIAFAMVIGAGASTALGASVVFFPALVKLASRKTLAGALGLSAGVMTYVSFVEIFQKSIIGFEDAGFGEDKAYLYATLCFFGGVLITVVSDQTVFFFFFFRSSSSAVQEWINLQVFICHFLSTLSSC
jgi:ZIP family zinc transporter